MGSRNRLNRQPQNVKTKNLTLIDGIIWLTAGINVVKLGVQAWLSLEASTIWLFMGCLLTLAAFSTMFVRMVFKNVRRIELIPADERRVLHCMSLRSFLIMIFMIALGISLRHSPLVPKAFIAAFYVGLGTALSAAGVVYLYLSSSSKVQT